ncbi:NADP-dependent oxidoreductase [Ramlibacter albus]|uniref:NADP-dependent oxidoreductase n=1 Tax=Ramlibacter albus TaxID=2079448 RepID=A0A923S359_9BURK|nr:NADP-dependent oxidoreductase [Ramlibacter albus]MBC5766071.1 NADP-dependent oxidoreductase [Ramlibacter albus]
MKAVRIHRYGPREELVFEDAPLPVLAPDEVLIQVVGASVNPVDWMIRQGKLKEVLAHAMPLTLGWDVSGVVSAAGNLVTRYSIGDSVYSRPDIARNGTYAEYVAVRAAEVAPKPATISHIEAASLPLAGITAWQALVDVCKLKTGQRVLVHAAAGGVGSLAVQIARARGAYVIGTASAANRHFVLSLGANEFVDYRTQTLESAIQEPVDAVLDTVGGEAQEASFPLLKAGGVLVSIVSPPPQELAAKYGVRGEFLMIGPNAEVLEQLAKLADEGKVRPVIGAEFALEDIARAHALSEGRHTRGKIVLYVGPPRGRPV